MALRLVVDNTKHEVCSVCDETPDAPMTETDYRNGRPVCDECADCCTIGSCY